MDQFDLAARGESDGLWDWNLTTNRIRFSRRWISSLGCEEHEVGDDPEEWFRRVHPEDVRQVRLAIDAHLAGSIPEIDNQHRIRHADGTYRWMHCRGMVTRDESGRALRLAGSHEDITAEKVTDTLTGLPNRLLLLDRLSRAIDRASRHNDYLFALLLVNLDRFNPLVERLGPTACEGLLIAAARRLETCLHTWNVEAQLRADYVVARLGGDEFGVLIEGLSEIGVAKFAADRLIKEISAPLELDGHEVFLSASMGIALSLTGYSRPEGLLRDADTAMRRAKSLGRARCEVFDTAALGQSRRQAQLETELQEALQQQEFRVYFQPIVSLASNQIAGWETLLRWHHPARGVISPNEFIPVAERTGLIVPLGQWVLREACRQLKAWQESLGIPKQIWISVNFSSLQFKQPALAEVIGDLLSEVKLEPHCLMLELTESFAMENPDAVSSVFMKLRVMGLQLGLDDFGTGYSSLGYLPRFPVDYLKIERSFVRRLETSKDMVEIVRAINHLAHQLGLRVVAEGIERAEQLQLVRSLGCEFGQGFLFSRAVESSKATELLKEYFRRSPEGVVEEEDSNRVKAPSDRLPAEPSHAGGTNADPVSLKNGRDGGRFARRAASLLAVAAALVLLLAGGYAVRLRRLTPTAAVANPAELPGAAEGTRIADAPRAGGEVPVVGESQKKSETHVGDVAASVVPKPPRKKPAATAFAVIHDHRVGSCRGSLEISPDMFSFISENGKDSFSLRYDQFTCSASDDYLTIKSGRKTFRFKSATAAGKDENRAQLQSIIRSIANTHPVPAQKK